MSSETKYLMDLEWMQRPSEFDRDHQAIMLACSRKQWLWTTYGYLLKVAGMGERGLNTRLKELVESRCIYLHKNDEGRLFFALRERIDRDI